MTNTPRRVLHPVAPVTETPEQTIARLQAELAKAKEAKAAEVYMKVSEKGAVSVYGLGGRWPVTLYAEQWERLAPIIGEVIDFIGENEGKVSRK